MRLTGRKRPTLTTLSAAVVLVAASMLAGRGSAVDPLAGTVTLDSGAGTTVVHRPVDVPSVRVNQARVLHTKGTPALPTSALAHLDIPVAALLAYQNAAAVMAQVDDSCGLSWTLLAAIGRVESDHGRFGGAVLGPDGVSSPAIRGVELDGSGPVAKIHDTDVGQLDGDPVWDRAVGPMQFLPSTWSVVAVDADGDGVRSPDDIDDAALAAAVFLCSGPGRLDTLSGERAAIFRYNPSNAYVANVLAVERGYRTGDFDTLGDYAVAGPVALVVNTGAALDTARKGGSGGDGKSDGQHAVEAGGPLGQHDPDAAGQPSQDPTDSVGPGSTGTPDPGTTGTPTTGSPTTGSPTPTSPGSTPGTPSATPSATSDPPSPTSDPPSPTSDPPSPTSDPPSPTSDPPSPTPDPPSPTSDPPSPTPSPVTLTGTLTTCGTGEALWCLGGALLDVGDAAFLATTAASDFDGDGAVETNTAELTGLVGTGVTVVAAPGTSPAVVLTINGLDYDPNR